MAAKLTGLKIVPISDTAYWREAAKLADVELRLAGFEQEEADALAAQQAIVAPPAIDGLTLEQLTAPPVAVPVATGRELHEIRRDVEKWTRAVDLQREACAKAKGQASKAAAEVANVALAKIASKAAAKIDEAVKIVAEADGVTDALQQAGYREEAYQEDAVTYRESDRAMRGIFSRASAVKNLSVDWVRTMAAIGVIDAIPPTHEGMYVLLETALAGDNFSYAQGEIVLFEDRAIAARLCDRGQGIEVPDAKEAAAIASRNRQSHIHRHPKAETAEPAEQPRGMAAALGNMLASVNPWG